MEVQELFYWVASIALMLIGLFVIFCIAMLFYIKRLADRTARKVFQSVEDMSEQVGFASRTWRNLTLTRFVLRVLKLIF